MHRENNNLGIQLYFRETWRLSPGANKNRSGGQYCCPRDNLFVSYVQKNAKNNLLCFFYVFLYVCNDAQIQLVCVVAIGGYV